MIKFNTSDINISIDDRVKMTLFAKWMAIHYSSQQLNSSGGNWWALRLKHFVDDVYPNYLENKSYYETKEYFEKLSEFDYEFGVCSDCGCQIPIENQKCEECYYAELPF
jgi:ribosomal protein L40E